MYSPKENEIAWRPVSVNSTDAVGFCPFPAEGISVDSFEPGTVIEIQRSDRSTYILPKEKKIEFHYTLKADEMILSAGIPTHRLWLESREGIRYKVPSILQEKDPARFHIKGSARDCTLTGDKYFNAVFEVVREIK